MAFGFSLAGPFHLDDHSLFSHPVVASADGWWRAWLETRPLTWFSFWLSYQVGGRGPLAWHAVSLALHLAAVLLAWNTLPRIIPRRPAFFGVALFAIHPIQAETVNYVFARATLLMTVFCLLALRDWACARPWAAAAWFAAALLSKEECSAFPLFLALLHLSISRNRAEWRPIGFMLVMALAAGLRAAWIASVTPGSGAGAQAGVAPLDYLATQGPVILRYFRLLLAPSGYSIEPAVEVTRGWIAFAAWAAILLAAALAFRRFDKAREGFWFLGGLVLLLASSSIFPAADLAADRRMYAPMIAFGAAAGLLLDRARPPMLAAVGVLLMGLSFQRTQVWNSERELWSEAARLAPHRLRPRLQLARALPSAEALAVLGDARRLAPQDAAVASELGRVYFDLRRNGDALSEYGRAIALEPNNARAYNNRGVVLLALGHADVARQDFARALAIDPCLFDARFNLRETGVKTRAPAGCGFSGEQLRLLEGAPAALRRGQPHLRPQELPIGQFIGAQRGFERCIDLARLPWAERAHLEGERGDGRRRSVAGAQRDRSTHLAEVGLRMVHDQAPNPRLLLLLDDSNASHLDELRQPVRRARRCRRRTRHGRRLGRGG